MRRVLVAAVIRNPLRENVSLTRPVHFRHCIPISDELRAWEWTARLDIDDDRMLHVDQVGGGVAELRLPAVRRGSAKPDRPAIHAWARPVSPRRRPHRRARPDTLPRPGLTDRREDLPALHRSSAGWLRRGSGWHRLRSHHPRPVFPRYSGARCLERLAQQSRSRGSGRAGSSRRSSDREYRRPARAGRTSDRQGWDAPSRTAASRSGCRSGRPRSASECTSFRPSAETVTTHSASCRSPAWQRRSLVS